MSSISSLTPPSFHIMVKPAGASCNLKCSYCFYLEKQLLYPDSTLRMSNDVMETYLRQLIAAHRTNKVTIAWQGGEPTLMGLDFFQRSIDFEHRYARPGMFFERTLQTNGTLLNDEWCEFLHDNDFLVGISIDGPCRLHDICRTTKNGRGTFDLAMNGLRLLQKHKVNYNILTTVNKFNAEYPLKVYRFLRDTAGAEYIQFIPIVEPDASGGVARESLRMGQWGNFLSVIFDEWVRRDVGKTFVINFDGILAGWLGHAGTLCIFGKTCGLGLALEHNGDLYSCDHYVDREHFLGNIMNTPLVDMVSSDKQRQFGGSKRDSLPAYCLRCEYLFLCNGECPKNRLIKTPGGEPGLNYLCEDYRKFFRYSSKPMQRMAALLAAGKPASNILPAAGGQRRYRVTATQK